MASGVALFPLLCLLVLTSLSGQPEAAGRACVYPLRCCQSLISLPEYLSAKSGVKVIPALCSGAVVAGQEEGEEVG